MKNLILFFLALFTLQVSAQKYTIEGNNVVVYKVVEVVEGTEGDKDEIYNRVKSYFSRSYGDANSVIQTDNKTDGLIIGKGLYTNLTSFSLGAWTTKAYYIIRVDIKDGRARIIASASTIIPNSSSYPGSTYEYNITQYYPITDKRASGMPKKAQEESFNKLVDKLNMSVTSIEDTIKKGGILNSEKPEW
ncbi:DUF4468 domain-containing protein [Elizabethkingia argentiflava]|uniref:DUF4468 domain-containing protein n=1 Tax=Elizabethkingia argenteiflava TaxID=2681556 RepID=A0A845PWK7_9FLAO|nr:DUF4468 domain-containing protein [Elizabethkingia argenteiflava]NAW52234.1 DUF4468 domain-containing protein [Elizabethkingia argenteiflava]